MADKPKSYPPGRQPYDHLNALRIGALLGGIIGMIPVAFLGGAHVWIVILFAVVGAAAGFLWQRRDEQVDD